LSCVWSLFLRSQLFADLPLYPQYLLEDLKAANHIVAGTTWKSIYPLISDDPRYLNLLGMLGSSPLDLFWDVVDALDFQAEEDQRIVESVLASKKSPVVEKTTWEEFEELVKGEERLTKLEPATLRAAFEKVSRCCRCSSARPS